MCYQICYELHICLKRYYNASSVLQFVTICKVSAIPKHFFPFFQSQPHSKLLHWLPPILISIDYACTAKWECNNDHLRLSIWLCGISCAFLQRYCICYRIISEFFTIFYSHYFQHITKAITECPPTLKHTNIK